MLEFSSEVDKTTFISLRALAKNGGSFKSAKQRDFLLKTYTQGMLNVRGTFERAQEEMKKYLGVELRAGEVYVTVDGVYRWESYGSRSLVPCVVTFILDKTGVIRQYKTNGNGNLRAGWAPNPEKCKLVWERPADAVVTVFEDTPVEEKKPSEYLGNVGDKIIVKAKIKAVKDLGYGQFGKMEITVFEDENGNVINVWKAGYAEVGAELTIKGTIKSCEEYRGVKQTTLTRVKEI